MCEDCLARLDCAGVYFVRCGEFIKIGYATDARARIRELQVGNPVMLELLRVVRGDRQRELEFHRRFADARVRGEWFRLDASDIEDIAA